jgi:hypothetical protein
LKTHEAQPAYAVEKASGCGLKSTLQFRGFETLDAPNRWDASQRPSEIRQGYKGNTYLDLEVGELAKPLFHHETANLKAGLSINSTQEKHRRVFHIEKHTCKINIGYLISRQASRIRNVQQVVNKIAFSELFARETACLPNLCKRGDFLNRQPLQSTSRRRQIGSFKEGHSISVETSTPVSLNFTPVDQSTLKDGLHLFL